ncbi:hypothetical protein PAHAL_7G263400 [Panicum hallii]|uniref:Protein SPIRAL1-like 5 n=1 Tax=Panicum hallii TaxID=206008 RepID=A0A2S3I9K4_9POAL|nr:protein SPIRAL1-like 4 [Panicum hallii]PAN39714.1 hypothetical protein PAHAL_7G263400 [Panicum hallii]
MRRGGMSSGGGRSSLGYLFEPEETNPYHTTAKSNQETEKTTDTNRSSAKDENKMIGAEADQESPQLPPPKREVSNPILSSSRPPCNIYHTSQLSYNNSGFLISDRPSTRVRCAPGGPSSLGFLFGEEHEK